MNMASRLLDSMENSQNKPYLVLYIPFIKSLIISIVGIVQF